MADVYQSVINALGVKISLPKSLISVVVANSLSVFLYATVI